MKRGARNFAFTAAPPLMKLVHSFIFIAEYCLRRAPAWAIVAALLGGISQLSPSPSGAAPPTLPPTNFHPFGPPTQLIPDGSVVPLRPIKPIAPVSPLFMMPQEPFGRLGQNWGSLGGAVDIEQKQIPAHRQPIELIPQAPRGDKKTTAGATAGGSSGGAAPATQHRGAAYRRPLGW